MEEITKISESAWFYEPYRNTKMLPLSTKSGRVGYDGTSNYNQGDFSWTEWTPDIIKEYCENVLFPNLGTKTRIVILKTPPQTANHEHIDCDPTYQFTQQHKFRIVLRGRTDTLYFIKKYGNESAPQIDEPFIMDGSWPHGMINSDNETKYTLTAGAPWNGLPQYHNLDILMNRNDSELPEDYKKYYKS
jgi:hypothetical protein